MFIYRFCKEFYLDLIAAGNYFQHFLLLAIRLFWGGSLFVSGLAKIEHIAPIITYFESLGIPFPVITAYTTAWVECVGGACLVVGFASRLVAIPIIFNMIGAFLTAHFDAVKTIISDPQNFIAQLPFNYLLAALIVFAFGPGGISVDLLLKKAFTRGRP